MKHLILNKALEINKKYTKEKLLYLFVDRPDYISTHNYFVWKNNRDQVHRNYNFPAVIDSCGEPWWYKNHINDNRKNNIALKWL